MDPSEKLGQLNDKIIRCMICPRLAQYIRYVGHAKVNRFNDQKYSAQPLPSWGDPDARLLIVGLAPAAHGANRTGRIFTGDSSGDWLARAMYETGFASKPASISKDDGLIIKDAYITTAVRCAPPSNKPFPSELANCSQYLLTELKILENIRIVIALGKIGFDAYCKATGLRKFVFGHGAVYRTGNKMLLASYHPGRQNTNTGRLTWQMWFDIFKAARVILEKQNTTIVFKKNVI